MPRRGGASFFVTQTFGFSSSRPASRPAYQGRRTRFGPQRLPTGGRPMPERRAAPPPVRDLSRPVDTQSPPSMPANQPAPPPVESFDRLPMSPATRAALAAMGIESPTPIQARTLAPLLAGRDVVGQARTGSGKTLAFAIPLVERCRAGGRAQALILAPTRELASQVASVVVLIGRGP